MKNFITKVILFINLDGDIKKKIIEEGFGKPVKLLDKHKHKYSTCPSNMPVEYFSKEHLIESKTYLTDKNLKVKVIESFHGLNFEAPCDKYSVEITLVK